MQKLCHKITFWFSNPNKYFIKDLKYIIQAPPKKPLNVYNLFVVQMHKAKKENSTAQSMKELGNIWKNMPAQQKEVYSNKLKAQKEIFQKSKKEYEETYVIPFKKVNSHALFVKHLYQDKVINTQQKLTIQQYGRMVGELAKNKTQEEVLKYNELAKKITEERQKKIQSLQFPLRQHVSQGSYTRKNPNVLEEDRKQGFEQYVEKWQIKVQKWLKAKKIDLSIEDFIKLYNQEVNKKKLAAKQKRSERLSQSVESFVQNDVKPKKKKVIRSQNPNNLEDHQIQKEENSIGLPSKQVMSNNIQTQQTQPIDPPVQKQEQPIDPPVQKQEQPTDSTISKSQAL